MTVSVSITQSNVVVVSSNLTWSIHYDCITAKMSFSHVFVRLQYRFLPYSRLRDRKHWILRKDRQEIGTEALEYGTIRLINST